MHILKAAPAALIALSLAACSSDGDITAAGIKVTRSACPNVAIPAATGDITLFDPPAARTADAIDVVATITNLRSTCDESGDNVVTTTNFDVLATRREAGPAREIVLPYFASVVQGGTNVVSKRLGRVAIRFEDGQVRGQASGTATGNVLRSAATLPQEIRRRITRERKPGDADAALDPMAEPEVRAAVQRATFEFLVGFQLTQEQLAYNATR